MPTLTTGAGLFTEEMVNEVFSKVTGHSAIATLSGQTPIPFAGVDSYVFSMDGEASLVGEGENKPAGEAAWKKVTVTPVKVVYQHRVTDEFINLSEQAAMPYLAQFKDGFSVKIARALDIMAFHGLNPSTKKPAAVLNANNFDANVTQTVTFDAANADDNLDAAVQTIVAKDGTATGVAMAPAFASALGAIKDRKDSKQALYPEFRFGGNPGTFGGMTVDVNSTVAFNNSEDVAIVGNFQGALKWGYTSTVKMEVIEYGNPDGLGDLKQTNEVCLRAEAYIGWGIIDPDSFVRVTAAAKAAGK